MLGQELLVLRGHEEIVGSVMFSSDGYRIVSSSEDGEIVMWDSRLQQDTIQFRGHAADVTCVAVSPDFRRLASGGDDNTIKIWDLDKGTDVLTLCGHNCPIRSLSFSEDGRRLVSEDVGSSSKMRVWDVETGAPIDDDQLPKLASTSDPEANHLFRVIKQGNVVTVVRRITDYDLWAEDAASRAACELISGAQDAAEAEATETGSRRRFTFDASFSSLQKTSHY